MAPPVNGIELTKFEKCDVKKDYGRLLRLETCYMDEDMKVASLMRAIPDLWRRRMCRSLLKNDTSETINSEDIFKFIDETVKENCERQSVAVMISDVYNIKFDNRQESTLSEFLTKLEEGYENIIDDKKVIKICVIIAFINGIPARCKESLCTSNRLPSYDEVYKFAMEEDIRFKNRVRYQRNLRSRINSFDERVNDKFDKKSSLHEIKREDVKHERKFDDKNKKIGLKSQSDSDSKKPEIVFQNLSVGEERKICTARCKIEGYDEEVIFGIDSCAEITTIPKNVYDKFPSHLKEKLNRSAKVFRVQGIHNSESSTEGSLMLKLTICNSDHKDMEIEVFIDPLSNIPLLCYDHLKKFNINPINLGFKKESDQFKDARTGLIFGGEAPILKKVLLEPESRVLLDKDYEPGNKLWAKFTVTEDYVPTRPKILPVAKNIEHLVLKELEEAISKGWLKKVKNGTLVENINQMVVVKKIDDEGNIKVRICHACLNVNKYIKLPELPELPNAKELLLMHGLETLSLFDIKSAFNRISLDESCKKYCYIGTPFGVFESQVLIFGLRISPYLFYKAMRLLFEDMEDKVKIYIDDLINISPLSIHDEVNAEICRRLRRYNLKLSPNKCFVNVKSAIFLGFKVDLESGITIPRQRMQALLGIECPDTPSALKRVIAKFQYFSMTVPNFPILVEPLHKQSIGEGKLRDSVVTLFEDLKNAVAKSISLEYIKEGCKSLSVYLACTRYAIASLMTCDYEDGSHRPFALGGRSLRCHEVNYLEGTKLLLGLKEILYENMIISTCFDIFCYTNVKNIDKIMNATPKVAVNSHQRIMLELLPFQITYKFCNTKENIISLLVESKFDEIDKGLVVYNNLSKAAPFNYEPLEPNEIKLNYLLDKDAKILAEIAKTGKWSPEQKLMISGTFKSKLDAISINDGLLFVEGKLFVPEGLIEKTIEWLHRHHQSYNCMINESKKFFIFNSISSRLKDKYISCSLCNNHRRNKVRKISSWPSVEFSHERFHGDIGEFKSKKFLCLYDCYLGYCITDYLKTESSSEVLKSLIKIYDRVGRPMIQVFDNATCFTAQKVLDELENLKIIVKYSIPMASQSNGSGEKGIGIIKSKLEKFWDIKKDFKISLAKATLAANERVFNKGLSAKELFFGYESNTSTLMIKYSDWNQPMDCDVLFKMKWGDKEWLQGKVIERLSENTFVIEYENKLYVRKIDVINFLKEGKIVKLEKVVDEYKVEEKGYVEDTSYEEMVDECLTMTQMDKIKGKSNRAVGKPLKVAKDYELVSDKADSEEEFQKIVDVYKPQLICATDGSEKEGKGFAYTISSNELDIDIQKCFKGAPRSSAQTLEVLALVCLLKHLNEFSDKISGKILIAIDNQYVYDGLACNLLTWEANAWSKTDNGILAHGDLWKCIRDYIRGKSWIIIKVRSHKGIRVNESVDYLARKGASLSSKDAVSTAWVLNNSVSQF